MRSSQGEYYVGLDHIRAFAAFLVFSWHFMHINDGQLTPLPGTFDFVGFSLFAEGYTGVSLFMVLSGYLFGKITDRKPLNYALFFRARAVRLLPLLIAVCLLSLLLDLVTRGPGAAANTVLRIVKGPIMPTLPQGGWSLTVEFHFYLLFPIMVLLERKRRYSSLVFVVIGFLVRLLWTVMFPESSVQDVAYWTIIGRIDQFVIGMLFGFYARDMAGRHILALGAGLLLIALYAAFDRIGGFYSNETYPQIWVWLLSAEGLIYAIIISWYGQSFQFKTSGISGIIAKVGAASYSIYLLHTFFVFRMARAVDAYVVPLDSFYAAFLAAAVCFVPVAGLSWLSFRYFETYWMRYRKPYLKPRDA